jgi:DNA polymerase-3 subunit gamma/tau
MINYLRGVAEQEGFSINDDCLGQVTRASEGSMRDALSLLEKIFVDSNGKINMDSVRLILGLTDRGRMIDLFEYLLSGEISDALEEYNKLYNDGADPLALLNDLCEITHWITLLKVSPKLLNDLTVSPDERSRGEILANKMSVRELARVWQLLVKVLDESAVALNVKMAVEMGLIRLSFASNLPTPDELIRKISNNETVKPNSNQSQTTMNPSNPILPVSEAKPQHNFQKSSEVRSEVTVLKTKVTQELYPQEVTKNLLSCFTDVVELIRLKRDIELLIEVEDNLRLVSYEVGRVEFEPTSSAATNLASRLTSFLKTQTESRWLVSVVSTGGGATIKEERLNKKLIIEKDSRHHPIVSAVFENFPGAKIKKIHDKQSGNVFLKEKAFIAESSDEWDPVEKE